MAHRSAALIRFVCIGAALLVAARVVSAAPSDTVPLSDTSRASVRTLGIVQKVADSEAQVFVFASFVRSGKPAGSSYSREFTRLLIGDKLDLHGELVQALESRLTAQPSPMAVRLLPMPAGARGIFQAAQKAAATEAVDAVLAFVVHPGYCAFKPDQPYLPFVTVRVTLFDVRSKRTIYDDSLSAGPAATDEGGVQVPAALRGDGALALATLSADPGQAAAAWRVQVDALADRLARQLGSPPAVPAPPATGEAIDIGNDAPSVVVGGRPLQARLDDAADAAARRQIVLRLPAYQAPYVLRVAGKLELQADKRWRLVTPTVLLLDENRQVTRVVAAPAAIVRGERVEQQVTVASPREVYAVVRASPQPPMPRWQYLRGELQDYGVVRQGMVYNLSGPMPASAAGPLEVTAQPADGALLR